MKKIIIVVLPFIIAFFLIFIVVVQKNKNMSTLVDTLSMNVHHQLYINTLYKENSQRVVELDLNNSKEKILLEKEIDDYPTSTYFEETKDIYFSGKVSDGRQQLFQKKVHKSKTNALTNHLNYIDFLQLDKTRKIIYMRALIKKEDRNFHLATFDIQTGNVRIWNENENDQSVVTFDFSPAKKNVLIVTKSIQEEFKNISKANKKNVSPKPPTYIFSIYNDTGTMQNKELKLNSFIKTVSLSSDGEKFLLNFKDKLEDTSKIGLYSKKKKKVELLLEDTDGLLNIREPIFDPKNNGFYFIADDASHTANVCFFNFKDQTAKKIWSSENEQPISLYFIK